MGVPQPRLGRRMARFNRAVTNRLTAPFAGRLPGFGIVVHAGRRSGRTYRTPVNVFRTADGWLFALTYGHEAQWVSNVLAAGGCRLITRGRERRLADPALFVDEHRRSVPAPVRPILGFARVSEFLRMSDADEPSSAQRGAS
jgi:deazaflavin-dependent oxidoreductase (nitroreductase family)